MFYACSNNFDKKGCLNKDSRSNFDNNKIVISLTVIIVKRHLLLKPIH